MSKKFYVVAHCSNGDLVITTTGSNVKYFNSRETAQEVADEFKGFNVEIEVVEV